MKAFLIDPDLQIIQEVDDDFEDFRLIQKTIEVDCFTIAGYIGEYPVRDAVFCDDEGLLKINLMFTKMEHYPTPLAGKILVIGAKADGYSKDVNISLEELTKQVTFMTTSQVVKQYGG
jgi:hypothetical protein